jgi:hypothetical protein
MSLYQADIGDVSPHFSPWQSIRNLIPKAKWI